MARDGTGIRIRIGRDSNPASYVRSISRRIGTKLTTKIRAFAVQSRRVGIGPRKRIFTLPAGLNAFRIHLHYTRPSKLSRPQPILSTGVSWAVSRDTNGRRACKP